MRTPEELRLLLRQVKNDNFQIPVDTDINDVIPDMLEYIGHTDSELRDKLIYSTFYEWAVNGIISVTQMKEILNICLDERHLFYCIGERDTDSVFTRAFSVLIVPLAFLMNRRNSFLSDAEIKSVKEKVLKYCKKEKDFRGYVIGKGWAHAVAHAADALDDICMHRSIIKEDLLDVLNIINEMIRNKDCVYICEEDERIVIAFMAIYQRKIISDEYICNWLNGFKPNESFNELPFGINIMMNQKNFLRSLYFRLLSLGNTGEICGNIIEILGLYN